MTETVTERTKFGSMIIPENCDFHSICVIPSNREAFEYFKKCSESQNKNSLSKGIVLKYHSGSGASHILKCYLNETKKNKDLRVMYITGHRFMEYLITALRNNRMDEFRAVMRNNDIFVLDDLEFVVGKQATQEELYLTFESLIEKNSQIICVSTKSISKMKDCNKKLTNLLDSFATLDVKRPSYLERMDLVKFNMKNMLLDLDNEEIREVAKKSTKSIQQLVGHMNQLKMKKELIIV